MAISLAAAVPPIQPAAAGPARLQAVQPDPVQVKEVESRPSPDGATASVQWKSPAPPVWPEPGTARVQLPSAGMTRDQARRLGEPAPRQQARVPGSPIWLSLADTKSTVRAEKRREFRVEVLDRAAVQSDLHAGVVMRIASTGSYLGSDRVTVTVDYSDFAEAYGADWALRLRMVRLTGCRSALSATSTCDVQPLPSHNDLREQRVTADIDVGEQGAASSSTTVALMADSSSPAGDYSATQLQPTSTWSAGGNAGNFAWTYPMRVPPSIGGPQPEVSLAYSSAGVDGRSEATNNQPSWIGEGFEYAPGFIERRYRPCRDDMSSGANNSTETGDLCWSRDNAILSLNGSSVELIRDGVSGEWRPKTDDGSRIERLTNTVNADNDNEYWRVTTAAGIQYYFGRNRLPGWTTGKATTESVWAVPVAGNHSGEPCRQASFTTSFCNQAWRWNLDYVVDLHGNTMSLWYSRQTNKYGRNITASDAVTYTRAGVLQRIDYGTDNRGGTDTVYTTAPVPMQVVFASSDRCLSSCSSHGENWPDTPWDQECSGSTCTDLFSPTFWSTSRLASVTTKIWDAGAGSYRTVDSWTLTHDFLPTGSGTSPALWLDAIEHTGHAGATSITLPSVTFGQVQLPNRVDTVGDTKPAMNWNRISKIWTESGGQISVAYSDPQCVPGSQMPSAAHTNTMRCYPVLTEAPGGGVETDYFHKYLVKTVTETDWTGGGIPVVTEYEYLGTPAWHYTVDDGITPDAYRTWSDYRGYEKVRTRVGAPGSQTLTETSYLRGMHGDRASPSGGTRSVQTGASIGDPVNDEDAWSGMVRERVVYNGVTTAPVSKTVTKPWQSGATATRTIGSSTVYARYAGIDTSYESVLLDGGRGWRTTKVVNTYDTYGMVTQVNDLGEVSANGATDVPGDEKCEKSTYVRNTSINLLNLPGRVQIFALACGQAATSTMHVIGDVRSSFDGQAYGVAPTKGEVTRTESLKDWSPAGGGTTTWLTATRASYDAYGRITESWDVRDNKTTTAYTPSAGGPLTLITTTGPLGWVSTQEVEPAWGIAAANVDVNNRRTEFGYDALGRLTKVWLPNRSKSGGADPNVEYSYVVRKSGDVNAVITKEINASSNYITTYALYDGLLRPRQTQRAGLAGSGTILTETVYDAAGRPHVNNDWHHVAGLSPSADLQTILEWEVKSQTVIEYDRANRTTDVIQRTAPGVEKWRTTKEYGGDRVYLTPPIGDTPTTTVVDARGNVIEHHQHKGATTAYPAAVTTYAFNGKDQLESVIDAAGNTWSYEYDIRGRRISADDPDAGVSTRVYNDYGDLTQSTNANSDVLAYEYDVLGRKVGVYDDTISTTNRRATWTYDTIGTAKGLLYTASRWIGDDAYTIRTRGYDAFYQSMGEDYVIPSSETGLSGTYTFRRTYHADGSLASSYYPAKGGLPSEYLKYEYDPVTGLAERVAIGVSDQYVANTEYTPFGDPALIVYQPESTAFVERAFIYDDVTRRLTQASTNRQVVPQQIADVTYSYDPAGNITKIADVSTGGAVDTQCFEHDYFRQLTEAWTPGNGDCAESPSVGSLGGPAPYWLSWTFDSVGNRLTEVSHAAGGDTVRSYSYPAAGGSQPHALLSVTTTGPGGSSSTSFTYDSAGNTATRPSPTSGTQVLDWDSEGRLSEVDDPGDDHSFVYDADGTRLVRRDGAGKTLYLPNMEVRYNTSTGSTTADRYYTYVDGVYAMRNGLGLTWLVGDHQSTQSIAVTSSSTQPVTRRRQTPYGMPRGSAPSWPNLKGFVGGDVDPTGLVHIGAREYDSELGRFTSVDPVQDFAEPQQWHGYNYANNSPVTFSDPTGLYAIGDNAGHVRSYREKEKDGTYRVDDYTPKNAPDHMFQKVVYVLNPRYKVEANGFGQTFLNGYPLPSGGPSPAELIGYLEEHCQDQHACNFDFACGNFLSCDPAMTDLEATAVLRHICDRGHCDTDFRIKVEDDNILLVGVVHGMFGMPGGVGGGRRRGAGGGIGTGHRINLSACKNSFAAKTEVLMADGSTKKISDVNVGDEVLATDPESGVTAARMVTAVIVGSGIKHLVRVAVKSQSTGEREGSVVATADHPVWSVTGGKWIDAEDLEEGEALRTNGRSSPAVLHVERSLDIATVYNLTVAGIHTYYVLAGNTPVLVHNTGPCGPVDAWSPGTFGSAEESATYHVGKHGKGRTLAEYTDEAKNLWARTPEGDRIPWKLRDGSEGWKIRGGFRGGEGIYTKDGKIVTWHD
ncbi:polymorphic toxin-type HINT domain-containing protein [Micromonospora sp. LOL_013]|uniref:polymorphic toxin-type HINT domain-containing protein n=1 Tax=Micromonospora sp. LOL_013 TaxID=3345414 RepID=UPI003A8701D1